MINLNILHYDKKKVSNVLKKPEILLETYLNYC